MIIQFFHCKKVTDCVSNTGPCTLNDSGHKVCELSYPPNYTFHHIADETLKENVGNIIIAIVLLFQTAVVFLILREEEWEGQNTIL